VGTSLKFALDFTTEFGVGPAPDSFGLALLGANMLPLVTTDLPGDELLHVDLGGFGAGVVQQRIEPRRPAAAYGPGMLAAALPLAFSPGDPSRSSFHPGARRSARWRHAFWRNTPSSVVPLVSMSCADTAG
jgi:hypothetical protein